MFTSSIYHELQICWMLTNISRENLAFLLNIEIKFVLEMNAETKLWVERNAGSSGTSKTSGNIFETAGSCILEDQSFNRINLLLPKIWRILTWIKVVVKYLIFFTKQRLKSSKKKENGCLWIIGFMFILIQYRTKINHKNTDLNIYIKQDAQNSCD